MSTLPEDLQEKKSSLLEFEKITVRALEHLQNFLNGFEEKKGYRIHFQTITGTTKYIRPINSRLFIYSPSDFSEKFREFRFLVEKLKLKNSDWTDYEKFLIDSILYTIQQSIGAGCDLLIHPNSARKHVGNRFEELIKCIFTEMEIANKRVVLQIPYETEEGIKKYKAENDIILSPFQKVKSTSSKLNDQEIVVSVKTTSKDRMIKTFGDKLLLEKIGNHKQKVIGIFLNDVQRKDTNNISFTLVSGLFMVYSKFLVELEGVYYLDPPPNARKEPFNRYMESFSELVTTDIWNLIAP